MKEQRKLKRFLLAGFIVAFVISVPQLSYAATYYSWSDNSFNLPGSAWPTTGDDVDYPYCANGCGMNLDGAMENPLVSGQPDFIFSGATPGNLYVSHTYDWEPGDFFRVIPTTSQKINLNYIINTNDESPAADHFIPYGSGVLLTIPVYDQTEHYDPETGNYSKFTTTFTPANSNMTVYPLKLEQVNPSWSFATMLIIINESVNLEAYDPFYVTPATLPLLEITTVETSNYPGLAPEYSYTGPMNPNAFINPSEYMYGFTVYAPGDVSPPYSFDNPDAWDYGPFDASIYHFFATGIGSARGWVDDLADLPGGTGAYGFSPGAQEYSSSFGANTGAGSFGPSSSVPELPQGSMAALGLLLAGLVIYLRKRLAAVHVLGRV